LATVGLMAVSAPAWAGLDEARDYLTEARKALENKDRDQADTSLLLAEAELEGESGAEARALVGEIASLKDSMATEASAEESAAIRQEAGRMLGDLKDAIEDWNRFNERAAELEQYISDEDNTGALGAEEIARIRKNMATFRKVAVQKRSAAVLEAFKGRVDDLERKMPEYLEALNGDSPAARNNAVQDYLWYKAEPLAELAGEVDESNAEAARALGKFRELDQAFRAAYAKVLAEEVLDAVKRNWEISGYQYEGWELETEGITFTQMMNGEGGNSSRLGAPRTAELVQLANGWLDARAKHKDYQLVKDDPRVAEYEAGIRKLREEGLAKLERFAEYMVADAEKLKIDQDKRDRLEYLANDILRLTLDGSPRLADFQNRVRALVDTFDAEALGAEQVAKQALEQLTAEAEAQWGTMVGRFVIADNLDPSRVGAFSGKTVRLTGVYNRAGWDFRSADYDFAITINGIPVAGNYDAAIKQHIELVLKRCNLGALPEETPYDVIGVVQGKGKITRMVTSEGRGTVDGVDVTAKISSDEKEECVVLRIVGLKIGPVAAVAPR